MNRLIIIFVTLFFPISAFANPNIHTYQSGAYFFIDFDNLSESRSYNCSYNLIIDYYDYGEQKSKTYQGVFTAAKNAQGNGVKIATSYTNPSVRNNDWGVRCG